MTTAGTDAAGIFADARSMHGAALDRLAAGDLRDAAEKAWCAAKRAVDGLILARTGEEIERSPATSRALGRLSQEDAGIRDLAPRYFQLQSVLHGECFYLGLCEPLDNTERLVREAIDFIQDAERLSTPS